MQFIIKKLKFLVIVLVALATLVTFVPMADAATWVNGYTRSNGTYVSGHYRSSPDGNPYNNWSYPGNTNPYTGKTATGNSSTYLNNYYGNNNSTSYSLPSYNYTPTYTYTPTYSYPSYSGGGSTSLYDYDFTAPTNPTNYTVYDSSKKKSGPEEYLGYYLDSTPYIEFSKATDNKKVKGYYVLWTTDVTDDPESEGKFTTSPSSKSPKFKKTGTYYLLIQAVDKAGNTSSVVYATYNYLKN